VAAVQARAWLALQLKQLEIAGPLRWRRDDMRTPWASASNGPAEAMSSGGRRCDSSVRLVPVRNLDRRRPWPRPPGSRLRRQEDPTWRSFASTASATERHEAAVRDRCSAHTVVQADRRVNHHYRVGRGLLATHPIGPGTGSDPPNLRTGRLASSSDRRAMIGTCGWLPARCRERAHSRR
jgi:hypothetical protein